MNRYAIYAVPQPGEFLRAAAVWLGYDALTGRDLTQPSVAGLPRSLAEMTREPRQYGFHGTIKPPFRLADGVAVADLRMAVQTLAAQWRPVDLLGLHLINLDGFLAFVPIGDASDLAALAADVVSRLDPFRAALTEAEIARRRPDRLTPRQRDLLAIYGYPYVMEEFRFHMTLSGTLSETEHDILAKAADKHFAELVPTPFVLSDLCLMGEDISGRFHLLHRYALTG